MSPIIMKMAWKSWIWMGVLWNWSSYIRWRILIVRNFSW